MIYISILYIFSRKAEMQIAKWGNSLAVRLPVDLVRKLGLKEGDQIEVVAGDGSLQVLRQPRPEDVLEALRGLRGKLPAAERLSRDAANER